MIVIPGPASQELGQRIANLLKARVVPVGFKRFPDGESYIRLDGEIKGEEAVIVQSTSPPQDTHLLQLFLMIDTAKDMGAKKVVAVVPYLAYARQDKRFLSGEAISVETIIKLLEASRLDQFITVNIHEEETLEKFHILAQNLSAFPLLAKHFKEKGLARAFSLAPDQGALEWAKEADSVLHGGFGWLLKERDRLTGEIAVEKKRFDVKGKNVIVFDDIISTGGTMAKGVKMVKDQGARKVYVACTHPLLAEGAEEKILKSGADGIVGTDCVPSPISAVSVAPLIARALSKK